MGRAYALELERLKRTVAFSCDADIKPLVALLAYLVPRNLIFVGSGGSFTAATFAAALHEKYAGRLARAVTPLEAACRPATTNTVAVLLSARGSNPDILKAFQALRFKEPIAAICATERNALLRRMDASGTRLGHGFSVPGGKDGFLATNSLIATLILLTRSYEALFGLPTLDLQGIGEQPLWAGNGSHSAENMHELAKADTIIALSSGWGWAAAIDLESKCSEAGLANVLLADYRNFAHGRHNWLRRRGETTAIVSLEDAANTQLADSILRLVPDDVRAVRLFSEKKGPAAGIDLVGQVLHLTGLLGSVSGVDPGRPPVAMFGRKMYRNGFKAPAAPAARKAWVARKAEAIGVLPYEDRDFVDEALDRFLERLRRASLRAVVADYDGTLCDPSQRFMGLSDAVARLLEGLVSMGLVLGVATGRGGSAHRALRNAIPQDYWDRVLVGLYNGAVVLPLSQEHSDHSGDDNVQLGRAYDALKSLLDRLPIEVSRNAHQMSLIPIRPLDLERLRRSAMELLHDIVPANQVRESSHSVDILSKPSSKGELPRAMKHLRGIEDPAILRIGDLGDWGGNDFDLLNDGLSLSVDRVSSRLDTCWNLGFPGSKGVTTTIRYLRALTPANGTFRFDVDSLLEQRAGRGGP